MACEHAPNRPDAFEDLAYQLVAELAGVLSCEGAKVTLDEVAVSALKIGVLIGFYDAFATVGSRLVPVGGGARLETSVPDALPGMSGDVWGVMSRFPERNSGQPIAASPEGSSEALTRREREILSLITRGLSNKQAAKVLGISPETVKSHMKRIFMKLAVGSRTEAVSHAVSLRLV